MRKLIILPRIHYSYPKKLSTFANHPPIQTMVKSIENIKNDRFTTVSAVTIRMYVLYTHTHTHTHAYIHTYMNICHAKCPKEHDKARRLARLNHCLKLNRYMIVSMRSAGTNSQKSD